MGNQCVVACPRCAATIDCDAAACPKCGLSMRGTPTMRRLEMMADALLDGFWLLVGHTLAHLIFYALLIAVFAFFIARILPTAIPW